MWRLPTLPHYHSAWEWSGFYSTDSIIKVMNVETTNLTSLPLCLAVVGIQTREIAVQVRDRNLHTTNQLIQSGF